MIRCLFIFYNKSISKVFLLFFLLLIVNLNAQQYQDAYEPFWYLKGSGASASGLAFNTTAYSENTNALITNPALLGKINKFKTEVSINADYFKQKARLGLSSNDPIRSNKRSFYPDNIGIMYPFSVYQGSFVMGISFTNRARYDYISESKGEDETSQGSRYYLEEKLQREGGLNSINIGASLEFQKDLFIGATIHSYNGYKHSNYTGLDVDRYNNFQTYDKERLEQDINQDYQGWNISFGLLYNDTDFQWGTKLSTPLLLNTNYKLETTDWYEVGNSVGAQIYDREYQTVFPWKISSGITFSLLQAKISIDMSINNWNNIDFKSDELSDSVNTIINNNIQENLTQTLDYGVGVHLPINNSWTTNFGYKIISKPEKDFTDEYKDLNILSLGGKYRLSKNANIIVSYQRSTAQNNTPSIAMKQEEYSKNRFSITWEYLIGYQE